MYIFLDEGANLRHRISDIKTREYYCIHNNEMLTCRGQGEGLKR